MIGLYIYLSGVVLAYIIIRIIGGTSGTWREVNDRCKIATFSWLTVIIFGVIIIRDLIDDAIWEYRYKHPKKPKVKKERKPIPPPKFL